VSFVIDPAGWKYHNSILDFSYLISESGGLSTFGDRIAFMGEIKGMQPADYEIRMRDDPEFSLRESSDYFERKGSVMETLYRLAEALESADIPYAVVGALALREHGYVRNTIDIDILTTREGLQKFHETWMGFGYMPAFPGARKKIRATESGVKIDVLLTGEYPGDGKPKAVSFPDPRNASMIRRGIHYLKLEKLIELKLASGLSAPHRLRDLVDIQDLIRETRLPLALADQLDESVRTAYQDLWSRAQVVDPHDQ